MNSFNSPFIKNYSNAVKTKNSILCVGLDPAISRQRNINTINGDDRLKFMKTIIHEVAPYASVIKINRQYIIGLSIEEIKEINQFIHEKGMLSIIDHKLSDIGSTNDSAIFWFKEEDFDAFTYSPFAGNIEETTKEAHKNGLGIIVLTLMSNPEASIQKNAIIKQKPLFQFISEECNKSRSDACVVGATGNVTLEDLDKIRLSIREEMILLVPGVGSQGGDATRIIERFGDRTMINIGRAIIYSEHPAEKAAFFQKKFNQIRDIID